MSIKFYSSIGSLGKMGAVKGILS